MEKEKYSFVLRETSLDLPSIRGKIDFEIRERIDKGVYEHFDLSRVIHYELLDIKEKHKALPHLLKALRHSWAIDITDFDIPRRKGGVAKCLVLLKKLIWKLLRFYTYRLFYQQREFNSLISNTLLSMAGNYQDRLNELEKEMKQLQSNPGDP